MELESEVVGVHLQMSLCCPQCGSGCQLLLSLFPLIHPFLPLHPNCFLIRDLTLQLLPLEVNVETALKQLCGPYTTSLQTKTVVNNLLPADADSCLPPPNLMFYLLIPPSFSSPLLLSLLSLLFTSFVASLFILTLCGCPPVPKSSAPHGQGSRGGSGFSSTLSLKMV